MSGMIDSLFSFSNLVIEVAEDMCTWMIVEHEPEMYVAELLSQQLIDLFFGSRSLLFHKCTLICAFV